MRGKEGARRRRAVPGWACGLVIFSRLANRAKGELCWKAWRMHSTLAMFNRFEEDQQFKELADAINSGRRLVRVSGLVAGAKALTIAALQRATSKRLAVVTVRERDVEDLERDLRLFENGAGVYSLPGSEGNPYSG